MTPPPANLLLATLRDPRSVSTLNAGQWDLLLRQARRADLLPRIAGLIAEHELDDAVPPAVQPHLYSAIVLAQAQQRDVLREIEHVRRALAPLGEAPVLLKGAAYVAAGLPAARGRVFADVDILLPRARLPEAEAALLASGWITTHHDAYDQRYYRQWMHELPPLTHIHRHTVLDVHHAILPDTARLRPDSTRLLASARPVAALPGLRVLAPVDMVLHSMTHLFHNEEMSHGLRDLSDLDLLLRHFAPQPGFWSALVARARELDLSRPLYYGLRYSRRLLDTPVPADVHRFVEADAPRWLRLADALWRRALAGPHVSIADRLTPAALAALYVRAHWLRMPPLLLARHLLTKALRREPRSPAEPQRRTA